MARPLLFEVAHRSALCPGRVARVTTPHGSFDTPAFMPVGTRGAVKGLLPAQVQATGAQIVLNNTYHMLLRPGPDLVRQMGGVHRFMGWNGPILTDSGGYQAYSMADINAIDEDGVAFKSIVDGSTIRLSPERAVEVQNDLGADIIMALDDCPPSIDPREGAITQTRLKLAVARDRRGEYDHPRRLCDANERTARWLERCRRAHRRPDEQALFGIIQGGTDERRRLESLELVCSIDLPGYAIGGVAVGEPSEEIARIVRLVAPRMPEDRPRYVMGVGYEKDLVAASIAGADMFDCVLPTRNGRNANAFTSTGQVRLRNARFREDAGPLEAGCDCPACDPAAHAWDTPQGRPISRAYLRHLFAAREMLGPILVSLHNLRHFQRLMLDIRRALRDDDWLGFAARWPVAAPGVPADLLSHPAPDARPEGR